MDRAVRCIRMDDLLEIPSSLPQKNPMDAVANDDESDDEGGLDWTKLLFVGLLIFYETSLSIVL